MARIFAYNGIVKYGGIYVRSSVHLLPRSFRRGEYDRKYKKNPYWGMKTGDILTKLRDAGYRCYGASVSPTGSAWDRACELYAQLAGTKIDYGRAHSMKNNHERYGTDYTGRPLIKAFDDDTRIVLIGHSFGGRLSDFSVS